MYSKCIVRYCYFPQIYLSIKKNRTKLKNLKIMKQLKNIPRFLKLLKKKRY